MAIDFFTLTTWLIFGIVVIINGFRLRICPEICYFDLSIYLGLVMGLIPLIYHLWENYISFFSSWIGRMEFGDFFIASSLFVACVALDIQQKDDILSPKIVKRTIGFFLVIEITAAIIYLFTDIGDLWTITIVIYDIMCLIVFGMLLLAIMNNDTKNTGTITVLTLFIIAFALSFALFYSEEIFYVAVITYYLAIIVYYVINYERLMNSNNGKNEKEE